MSTTIKAAKDYLDGQEHKRTFWGPLRSQGRAPPRGESIFHTSWRPGACRLEAISYPKGMAYEKDGGTVLWTPKDPGK